MLNTGSKFCAWIKAFSFAILDNASLLARTVSVQMAPFINHRFGYCRRRKIYIKSEKFYWIKDSY